MLYVNSALEIYVCLDHVIFLSKIQFFRNNNNYAKASRLLFFGFAPSDSDDRLSIILLWGVKERDMSSCHFSEEGCLGTGGYDNNFDASTLASQKAFAVSVT